MKKPQPGLTSVCVSVCEGVCVKVCVCEGV